MYLIFTIGWLRRRPDDRDLCLPIGWVVTGEPCEEARELEQGHLHHADPRNPATGELEDTDVGFPGSEHQIAERRRPMAIAMTILDLALIGGVVQIPGVTDLLEQFFRGTFESSPLFHIVPSTGASWLGLLIGGLISIAGIAIASTTATSPARA